MKRDIGALSDRQFDLAIIGGGIYGACIARDAALRGLSVALVEKSDFCSGTSHNSLKIIHSGIRYLQHLDFRRIRESIVERRIWLSIAPHLVRPLEFVIPTQGYLTRGPMALQAGILLHRLLGPDWNSGVPRGSRIPLGRVYGRGELAARIPGIPVKGLSGAASWYDGQVIDTDRVVLECLQSAAERGAAVANYVAAESLMQARGCVEGIVAVDQLTRREIEIRAKLTVNAAGPWIHKLLQSALGGEAAASAPPLARNMNIVTRQILPEYGVGIPSKRQSDAVIGSENRLFFVTPWKDVSVIGTTHFPYEGQDPDSYSVSDLEVSEFVEEINDSYPPARLTPSDIYYVYSGLTPAEPETAKGEVGVSKHAEIIDHGTRSGCSGLFSVIGVKFTTARLVAERVVAMVQEKIGQEKTGRDRSLHNVRSLQLPGAAGWSSDLPATALPSSYDDVGDLLGRYGSRLPRGVSAGEKDFSRAFAACIEHAVDNEMAVNLDDFLIRRNDLAVRGRLPDNLLQSAAVEMGRKLSWSAAEVEAQCARVRAAVRCLSVS